VGFLRERSENRRCGCRLARSPDPRRSSLRGTAALHKNAVECETLR